MGDHQASVRGFVEVLAEHVVGGWVFDDAHPDQHLTVVAKLDGREVGQALAGIARPDLREAGIGAGDHGFKLFFVDALSNAALARLEVQAVGGDGAVKLKELPGSNQSRADAASNGLVSFRDLSQKPVFILGPARSGTSALALALLKSGRYDGFGEGHLFPLARELLRTVGTYYSTHQPVAGTDTLLNSVSVEAFERAIRRSFVQLTREAFPRGYWLDKTPTSEMVRVAPLMLDIWPNAKFIFMKRRLIENILSRRRKFPDDTLQNHYLDWVEVMSAWRDVRDSLGNSALEAEQMVMARENDAFAAGVSAFLDLPAENASLFCEALQDHPEQTSEQVGAIASLASLNLSDADRDELQKVCDPIMRAFGYGYGADYRSDLLV